MSDPFDKRDRAAARWLDARRSGHSRAPNAPRTIHDYDPLLPDAGAARILELEHGTPETIAASFLSIRANLIYLLKRGDALAALLVELEEAHKRTFRYEDETSEVRTLLHMARAHLTTLRRECEQ